MAELKPRHLSVDNMALQHAFGRVLAEGVRSNRRIPPTDISAMEGYAIRSQDTKSATFTNPTRLRVVGRLFAHEETTNVHVRQGEAVFVATGATIPQGADTVVRMEHAKKSDGEIATYGQIKRGRDISYAGDDIPRGLVFAKGHVLRPQDVEVLAALRLRKVKVFSKPRVAIISIGDELREVGDRDSSEKVDSHALNISGLLEGLGAVAKVFGVAEDKEKAIKKFVKRALDETDIILTIAGVSIGEEDFVTQAVSSFPSAKILAHGVAMKPGKPTLVAVVKGKPLIGLPGHVASTNAAFYAFATKLIERYSGATNLRLPTVTVELDEGFKSGALYSFVRFKIREIDSGFIATPLDGQITLMRDFVRSNGFAIFPPRRKVAKGDRLSVTLYSIHEFHHIAKSSATENTVSTLERSNDVEQAA